MLVFKNGRCKYINQSDVPVQITEGAYDGDVECFVDTLSEDKRGRYDQEGRYKNCTYSILLNFSSVDLEDFNPSLVDIEHNRKGNLGTFTVQRVEFYEITKTVELWI